MSPSCRDLCCRKSWVDIAAQSGDQADRNGAAANGRFPRRIPRHCTGGAGDVRSAPPLLPPATLHAAAGARSTDLSRAGLPPGGVRGKWSRLESASRMSSIETGVLPGIARNIGFEVTTAASEAQEARIARFSPSESEVSARTSLG